MSYSPPASRGPLASAPASSGTQHSHTKQPSTMVETLCRPLRHDPVHPLGAQASASAEASPSGTPFRQQNIPAEPQAWGPGLEHPPKTHWPPAAAHKAPESFSGPMAQLGPQRHVPASQEQFSAPHALVDVGYPHCPPMGVQALPVWGKPVGQGACQVPSRHWQLDPQPEMPPVQRSVLEQAPPSAQVAMDTGAGHPSIWHVPPVQHGLTNAGPEAQVSVHPWLFNSLVTAGVFATSELYWSRAATLMAPLEPERQLKPQGSQAFPSAIS
jgi:hypothetical protein